jgi:tRNA U55 pseudouridine synthase TruB
MAISITTSTPTITTSTSTITISTSITTSTTTVIFIIITFGSYIRSLVHDVGKSLGVGAYLAQLCRTACGHVTIDEAWTLDQVYIVISQNVSLFTLCLLCFVCADADCAARSQS